MAEQEIVAAGVSPVPSDHKRKFQDLESEAPQPTEPSTEYPNANSNPEPDEGEKTDAAVSDEAEKKRARLDEKLDGLANENGYQDEQVGQPIEQKVENSTLENVPSQDGQPAYEEPPESITDGQPSTEISEPTDAKELPFMDSGRENIEEPSKETQQLSEESAELDAASGEKQTESIDITMYKVDAPNNKQDDSSEQKQSTPATEIMTRKIEVPNNKVGVLIGKAGDTIRYLQYNSGAKIQITRDADADPHSATRPVELIGSLDSIEKADKLISAVIAEADAGGSPSLVARGLSTTQVSVGSEQIQIQVPNEKVGLIIGRGGETIKGLQTKSGARIQLIPQHLPEGDDSKERTVQVTGDKRQIEIARELIKEVMSQPVRPSTGGFSQQAYRPHRGSAGPPQWGQRGSHFAHPTSYDYQHRGPYPSHSSQYGSSHYGSYPQHMAPRSNFGSGWEQRPNSSMQGPPPHVSSYDYYGGQGGHLPDAPAAAQHPSSVPPHAAGPSPVSAMGPPPAQANYNYGQPQGPEYGHQAPYSQAAIPQQSYGHGYDEPKFENRAPTQHPYGGHASSQPNYPQTGAQPGFAQHQYGKPPVYGMPSQGQLPQSYGPPRATQPVDMPSQGYAQSYGGNVPSQQQPYPYASSGQPQGYPPYGVAPAADSYNNPQPASGPVYGTPGGQTGYAQSAVQQQPGYGQVAPTVGYGSYPSSQQAYSEQPAANNTGYGYQGSQDPNYSVGPSAAYTAVSGAQAGYVQPAPTQTGYNQSNPQSAGYGAVQASAPAAYGKTVSPQPTAYPQYDSTQVYAAPQ